MTIIVAPPGGRFICIREDYVRICDQNYCAAALLEVFRRWYQVKVNQAKQAGINNRIAEANGVADGIWDAELWVYLSVQQIQDDEIFGMYSDKTIRNALIFLEHKGFIQTRTNPRYKMDRTTQYLFCEEMVRTAHSVNLPNALGKSGECDSVNLPNDPQESSQESTSPLTPEGEGEGTAPHGRKIVQRVRPPSPAQVQKMAAAVNQAESTGENDLPSATPLEQWIVEQIRDTGLIKGKGRLSRKLLDRLSKSVSYGGKSYCSANEQFDMHPLFKFYALERVTWWKGYAEKRTVDFLVNLICDFGKQQYGWLDYLKDNMSALHATIEKGAGGELMYHWWLGIQDDQIIMITGPIANVEAAKIYAAQIRAGFPTNDVS
jgi:hypothetical protein